MQLARRNLLKGGLLCSTAAVAAVATSSANAALQPKAQPKTEEWDVVVVGAGFAGLSAAPTYCHDEGKETWFNIGRGRASWSLFGVSDVDESSRTLNIARCAD